MFLKTLLVKPGIVTGEAHGKLSLRNTSSDQTMRLVGGKISCIGMQGKPIVLEDNRTAGRRVPGRGIEGEELEGSAPGARVHPVAVPRGNAQLHGLDRRPVKRKQGWSLSRWILLVLILTALGVPQRGSAQAGNAAFDDAMDIRSQGSRWPPA